MSNVPSLEAFGFVKLTKAQQEAKTLAEIAKHRKGLADKAAEKAREEEELKESAAFTNMVTSLNDVRFDDVNDDHDLYEFSSSTKSNSSS